MHSFAVTVPRRSLLLLMIGRLYSTPMQCAPFIRDSPRRREADYRADAGSDGPRRPARRHRRLLHELIPYARAIARCERSNIKITMSSSTAALTNGHVNAIMHRAALGRTLPGRCLRLTQRLARRRMWPEGRGEGLDFEFDRPQLEAKIQKAQ